MLDVWNILKFKTFKDYHNLYLKKDILLLTDIFEKFISTCLKYYNLDPTYYFSAPGLSFDAMLKMTTVELDKIDNPNMHLFIEEGMRGRICVAAKKYSKANNEYFKDYDTTKKRNEMNYDDMNNLYGKAMMSYLPYKGFKWINITDEHVNKVSNKKDNKKHGYILKVDMYLPDELHNQQRDFPMVPEKLILKENMLSRQQIVMMKKFNIKIGTTKKLIPNLFPKEKYVVHLKNLKYYLRNGWILTKVYGILELKQLKWMKLYIEFNTPKRMQATYRSDKEFFKLMINSVYGKTMENMRKRMKIRIVNNQKDCIKYSSRPTFINSIIHGTNLIAINEKKIKIKLNKPIYVGFSVLEESKLIIYKYWYDFLKKVCPNVELIYMDTDSFIFDTESIFDEIRLNNKEYFDLSDYPKNSNMYDSSNKKVPGIMKNEKPFNKIKQVYALKSKSCNILMDDNKQESKHKGHDHNFTTNEYHDVTFNKKVLSHPLNKITSIRHDIFTKETIKKTLDSFDEKRYLCDDGIHALPLGHKNRILNK